MRRHFLIAPLAIAGIAIAGPAGYLACSAGTSAPASSDGGTAGDDGGSLDGTISLTGSIDARPGGPCEASTDCPPGLLCLYPVAEGCGATSVCEVLAASECKGPYCTCRGDTTGACGDFAELPLQVPLHGPPCGAASAADSGD